MAKYRNHLPQLDRQVFLMDGGIETTLIFHEKIDLPCFAAFDLLKEQRGTDILRRYYARYAAIACESGTGFVPEPTKPVTPGVFLTTVHASSVMSMLTRT